MAERIRYIDTDKEQAPGVVQLQFSGTVRPIPGQTRADLWKAATEALLAGERASMDIANYDPVQNRITLQVDFEESQEETDTGINQLITYVAHLMVEPR